MQKKIRSYFLTVGLHVRTYIRITVLWRPNAKPARIIFFRKRKMLLFFPENSSRHLRSPLGGTKGRVRNHFIIIYETKRNVGRVHCQRYERTKERVVGFFTSGCCRLTAPALLSRIPKLASAQLPVTPTDGRETSLSRNKRKVFLAPISSLFFSE